MELQKIKKIFIVDDDPMLSEALSDYLTRKVPHLVTQFETGEKAIARLDDRPDVVVLDYHLDSVEKGAANGMEILQYIKKHFPSIPVIMLSSQEAYSIAMRTLQKGAEQYVVKDDKAFENVARLLESL